MKGKIVLAGLVMAIVIFGFVSYSQAASVQVGAGQLSVKDKAALITSKPVAKEATSPLPQSEQSNADESGIYVNPNNPNYGRHIIGQPVGYAINGRACWANIKLAPSKSIAVFVDLTDLNYQYYAPFLCNALLAAQLSTGSIDVGTHLSSDEAKEMVDSFSWFQISLYDPASQGLVKLP